MAVTIVAADLLDAQLEELGDAAANLEAAVAAEHEAIHGMNAAKVVGEMLVLALALKGYVIRPDPVASAEIVAEMVPAERLN